jgi:2-iminobutanoate/2-iminopropanoate deaminase
MSKQILSAGNAEGLPFSEAVRAGDFIFLSGMVGFAADGRIVEGGVSAETDAILAEARRLLQLADATLDDVVKVNVYLSEPDDFDQFNVGDK